MPKKKSKMIIEKKSSILLVISNIIMLVVFILTLLLNNSLMNSLYWFILPLVIVVNLVYINLWTKRAINPDNKKSKEVNRSADDITIVSTVIYALIYLGIIFIEQLKHNMTFNMYVIVGFYVLTIIYELICTSSIKSANKEMKDLIEKYGLGK